MWEDWGGPGRAWGDLEEPGKICEDLRGPGGPERGWGDLRGQGRTWEGRVASKDRNHN